MSLMSQCQSHSLHKQRKVHQVLREVHHTVELKIILGAKERDVFPHVNARGYTEDVIADATILRGPHTMATR